MKSLLLTIGGFVMLAMGAVGVVLPIWPTTPFVLAAAGCFAGNPKILARIMKIPFVNEYIANRRERRGISRRTVIVSLTFLWVMLAASAAAIGQVWAVVLLAAVGAAVTTHILIVSKPRKQSKNNIDKRKN